MQARRRDLAEIIVDVVQTGVERREREQGGGRSICAETNLNTTSSSSYLITSHQL